MNDVSDSLLLNQKLFQSELKLRQFFAAIPDLVMVISLNGSIEFIPTQINLADPRNQLIIEATTNEFFHGGIDGAWLSLARIVIKHQQVENYEYSLRLADQTTDWFMDSIAPLAADEVVCIIRNITELKNHEIQLAKAKEAAEVANRSKTIFLQNISHELRTPLNAMIGFTQLLQEQPEISATASKYLIYILNNSYYLLAMVNQLLDLARIESDVLHTTLNLCHTRSFIQEIMDQFLAESNRKNLELILDIEIKVPQWIYLDALKVRQILQNLIHNAVKFTQKGSIKLELSYQEEITDLQLEKLTDYLTLNQPLQDLLASSSISNSIQLPIDHNAWLCLMVTDTGVGILPEEKSLIWQPFSQGQAGRDSDQGVGLGLAIFQRLIRHLGAQIFFDSTVGLGTKFTVLLPIKVPQTSVYSSQISDGINDDMSNQIPDQTYSPYANLVHHTDYLTAQPQDVTCWEKNNSNFIANHQSYRNNLAVNLPITASSDDVLAILGQDDLNTIKQLVLKADFNGLQSFCATLETIFPNAMVLVSRMIEEFAYQELLNFIEDALEKHQNNHQLH